MPHDHTMQRTKLPIDEEYVLQNLLALGLSHKITSLDDSCVYWLKKLWCTAEDMMKNVDAPEWRKKHYIGLCSHERLRVAITHGRYDPERCCKRMMPIVEGYGFSCLNDRKTSCASKKMWETKIILDNILAKLYSIDRDAMENMLYVNKATASSVKEFLHCPCGRHTRKLHGEISLDPMKHVRLELRKHFMASCIDVNVLNMSVFLKETNKLIACWFTAAYARMCIILRGIYVFPTQRVMVLSVEWADEDVIGGLYRSFYMYGEPECVKRVITV